MDKLELTGENLAEFSTLEDAVCMVCTYFAYLTKQPNLELKARPKQLSASLPLDIALPDKKSSMVTVL